QPRTDRYIHCRLLHYPWATDHSKSQCHHRPPGDAGTDVAGAAARHRTPRAAAVLFGNGDDAVPAADAGVSDAGEPEQQRQHFRPELPGRSYQLVDDWSATKPVEGHG